MLSRRIGQKLALYGQNAERFETYNLVLRRVKRPVAIEIVNVFRAIVVNLQNPVTRHVTEEALP
ncbi:MAG: hypothetical protein CMG77_01080 [Marinimicrobium sp.]|jgi:hypothetical protein|nr:hypothetical protein [Marinimicrobium sp.]|tara:strand:+ start:299 stop:490 length:192 start_codon:yes stop_codon:yes gene_type:complete